VGVGDHGGGVNLAEGCSGRSVHGEVASVHGGGIAGEVVGRNWWKEGVCRVCEGAMNLTG
jgi:hypothetical protein